MIKSFLELSQVDVTITKKPTFKLNKYTKEFEKQEGKDIDTLSWVHCLLHLYENGAKKVDYEQIPNPNGGLLFLDDNKAAHIKVYVDIDGERHEHLYPVIDGSKDIPLDKITQSDIYNAKQRAFVKCVAVNWGLGIKLWAKEINPDTVSKTDNKPNVFDYFRTLVNTASQRLGGVPEMLKHLDGVTEKQIKSLLESAKQIDAIEKTLGKVLEGDKESK